MSQQPVLELCGLCETYQPSGELVDIRIRDLQGHLVNARMCRRCAAPRLTYIAGHLKLTRVDVPRLLGLAFGLTVAVLNIAFGFIVQGPLGLFIALTGVLAGAGISLAFAVSIALPHAGELQP